MVPPVRPAPTEIEQTAAPIAEIEPEFEAIEDVPEEPAVEPEPPIPVVAMPLVEAVEIVVDVEEPDQAETLTPPLSDAAAQTAAPRSLPSVVVTPAIYATVSAAIETVTKKDRWILVAVVAAILVTGGFIWLATLPGGASELDLDAPPPAAEGLAVDVVDPVELTDLVGESAPVGATAPAVRPVVRSQGQGASAPLVVPPSAPSGAPRPYIETAPLAVEPPTPAASVPTDPQAPIATGPQPLN